tara:strand:+ start:9 stop:1124 length:1116 start_codon:yes stop_codon:yes gene_type:complete
MLCEYYKENAITFLREIELFDNKVSKGFISYEPLGVIFGIMPWNFPFWQVFRFAMPTIIAGNSIIVKHASNVTGCLLQIKSIFDKSILPKNIFNVVVVSSNKTDLVINSSSIKAISLTGSEHAGMCVASLSGKLVKKNVLELGGSDPFIVFKNSNLQKAAVCAVKSRMLNTGQSCIAAKRFIIEESIHEEFIELIKSHLSKMVIGDPSKADTQIGPLARNDLVEELDKQVKISINLGAKLLYGGDKMDCKGFYYEPTILTNVKENMPIFHQEVFGPVFAIITFKTEKEAIEIANKSKYGLGASIWLNDLEHAKAISKQIDSGMVAVNEMMKSDPKLPFGGIKLSGYGKELSEMGIKEFVNAKTIVINKINE